MATTVKGDQYEMIDGKLHEIKRQIRQKGGYPFDPARLDSALQAVIEGRFEAIGRIFSSTALAAERGFTVVEDVTPSEFKVSDLELVSFLKPEDNGFVDGETLRARAVTLKANLGLMDAKYILDRQSEIPTEFKGKALVFTGTLLRGSYGGPPVACLCWFGGRWCLDFYWIGSDFSGYDRLLRCK